jgi:hypothetical protein
MTLAEHNLLTFRMFQIYELLLFPAVRNLKTDDVPPEGKADIQVGDMKLRDHVGPAHFWRRAPISTHFDEGLQLRGAATITMIDHHDTPADILFAHRVVSAQHLLFCVFSERLSAT